MTEKSLKEIAEHLKNTNKKVQLIYAFNGTGKTRLSREFKNILSSDNEDEELNGWEKIRVLYYNAFTEDLFYWSNDLDVTPILQIQPNTFTDWIFLEQGKETEIINNFQNYTQNTLTPSFNKETERVILPPGEGGIGMTFRLRPFSKVTFSQQRGDDSPKENIKISKGEESLFIWSVFYSLIDDVINILNITESGQRSTDEFNYLEYIFIDDPVSSLDDNHLIQLAVDLAYLITRSESKIKFIITTHSPLFYNVLFSELKNKVGYILRKREDGLLEIEEKFGDSNTSFSYHLHIKKIIEDAINNNSIQKYHFMLLRNLYEKTASFLGYQKWGDLLPDDKKLYLNRIIQFTSHSSLSNEVIAEPTEPEKNIVKFLLTHLTTSYHFWQQEER